MQGNSVYMSSSQVPNKLISDLENKTSSHDSVYHLMELGNRFIHQCESQNYLLEYLESWSMFWYDKVQEWGFN